jgi:recombination protein RecT
MADKELALVKEDALNVVTNKINDLQKQQKIVLPQNYSPENAMNSAWLMLQDIKNKDGKLALDCCTKNSIIESLYNMVLQGLSPAKKQCYFVVYGDKLQLSRSYMGTVAVTKRLKGIKDIKAFCIYEGDEFEQEYTLETATLKITKFNPRFENIDIEKIKGAFAVVMGEDGPIHTEVMNIKQIRNAWNQGYAKGNSGAHKNFTDEMAKKSVINRACKMYANTSDDSDLLIEAINNSDEKDFDGNEVVKNAEYEVKSEIKEKGNSKVIDIETPTRVIDVESKPVNNSNLHQVKMGGPDF